MAKPYASEIDRLSETFDWIESADITALQTAIATASSLPLVAIGSGGSLSAAHGLAGIHRAFTRKISTVSTPLEVIREPIERNTTHWLLSAGGRNVDILAAAKALIQREPKQLAVMTGRNDTKLTELCRAHPFIDLHVFSPPAGKDGFLATNSLFGFVGLFERAYGSHFGAKKAWAATNAPLRELTKRTYISDSQLKARTDPLWDRTTTVILHGPSTRLGAIDIESKFTEAALGSIQLADFRNFAHGRHHWLAKRGDDSGVLALVIEEDRALAEKTLALLPPDIPLAILEMPEQGSASLASLLVAFHLTGLAGMARGIDPGRPGVPMFGRELYRLRPPRTAAIKRLPGLSARDEVAIERKAGETIDRLETLELRSHWQNHLKQFRAQIFNTVFPAVVLDYDGTVVETRSRWDPPAPEICEKLRELVDAGIRVCIATGRGKSARHALQSIIAKAHWDRVLIGYYNGAELGQLLDNEIPNGTREAVGSLLAAADTLRSDREISQTVVQEDRPFQITLTAKPGAHLSRLHDHVIGILKKANCGQLTVVKSGHSLDILAPSASKLNVHHALHEIAPKMPILSIGDSGALYGNDHAFLSGPYSLSVDKISSDPTSCWNLGSRGQRGPAVLAEYFSAIELADGGIRLREGALK